MQRNQSITLTNGWEWTNYDSNRLDLAMAEAQSCCVVTEESLSDHNESSSLLSRNCFLLSYSNTGSDEYIIPDPDR